jgi:hypothetical protein
VFIEEKIQHESWSRKYFQASRMRAIDSPHEITPRNMILREKFQKFSIFAFTKDLKKFSQKPENHLLLFY